MPFLLVCMTFCIKLFLCEAAVSLKNQIVFVSLSAFYNIEYELFFSLLLSPIASYNLCI